ncbi:MAG: protein phosphatase 2C domain-containing protein [Candidatus Sericytochromatia bacterium]|nr:protein phosphatase 2C domain-containing protein [Candidatus Tanganyikabacteria bacterium]
MSAVAICPKPGCRSENTGRYCNRCGTDLAQIACPTCERAYPDEALGTLPGPACEDCQTALAVPAMLIAPAGHPDLAPGDLACDGRFRIMGALGAGQYLAVDCKPYAKRLAEKPADDSVPGAYRRLAHLPGLPSLLDAVRAQDGGEWLLSAGPVDRHGNLFPAIADRWPGAATERRLAWLTAWVRLAIALATEGWAQTVLDPANLRIAPDGNLAVRTLLRDAGGASPAERLAAVWRDLAGAGADAAVPRLIDRLAVGESGLVDVEHELLALRGRPRTDIRHHGATDTGRKRENNEDSYLGWQAAVKEMRPEGPFSGVRGLFAVCDGMGGHERGEVASRTCVQMVQRYVVPALMGDDPGDGDLAGILRKLVREEVNAAILARNGGDQDGPFRRMGTTVVMVAVVDDRAVWVHVGDSRIYLITGDRIEQVTEDHNVGTRDVKLGVATMLEAFRSPVGKHLTQALGPRSSEFVHPDTGYVPLTEPCYLLLCSDGLADMVPESDVHKTVVRHWDDPEAAVADLIAQANDGGGLDNITALAIRVEPLSVVFGPEPSSAVEQPQRV